MTARWTEDKVLDALPLAVREDRGNGARPDAAAYPSVSTDTRALEEGALFVALRGENFDAHDFLGRAAEQGARAAVVERVPDDAPPLRYYRVPDTLTALGRLGRYWRRSLDARVAAITGTNGKTTTKDMARAILSTRYRTHATAGNLNNLIGAPLTLLATPSDAEALVVEIGMNIPGEIARLAEIVEPDVGVVTSIGPGHLEGVGTIEGVLREKTTLLSRLRPGGVAVVADEPSSLADRARSLAARVRVAGWSDRADADLRADGLRIDEEGRVRFTWQGREVSLPFGGRAHVRNALIALGVGLEWDVDPGEAVAALETLEPPRMRGEVHRYGDLTVIADCYNSNPSSLEAAVETLQSMPRRGGRVLVVGSMLELGPGTRKLHRDSAREIASADVDLIVAVGLFEEAFESERDRLGDRLITAPDAESAFEPMAARMKGQEMVLLKGSRGVALEQLMPKLEDRFAAADRGKGG